VTCGFEYLLIGLLAVVVCAWITMGNVKTGRIWAGKLGFIERGDNRFGFWSAVLSNWLLCVAALAVVWLFAAKQCRLDL
jgi:uncharacterized membrane protein